MLLVRRISKILLALALAGCGGGHPKHADVPGAIKNIGHAGSGFNYLVNPFNPLPPNSYASLIKAVENGADGVEVDLQITSDFKLVLFHDLKLEKKTRLTGSMHRNNSRQVIGALYECGFPYDFFHDETIIEFSEWIKYAASLPEVPYLQIDMKTADVPRALVDSMVVVMIRELKEADYPFEKVMPITMDPIVVLNLLKIDSRLQTALEIQDMDLGIRWAKLAHCKYLVTDQKYLSIKIIDEAHKHGISVVAFGGKSKSTLEKVIAMKPDFIQSNNVKLLYELLH